MIALLGTPSTDKRHVILPVGHAILVPEVRATVMREVLDWLDRYPGTALIARWRSPFQSVLHTLIPIVTCGCGALEPNHCSN